MRQAYALSVLALSCLAAPVSAQIEIIERPIDEAVHWCAFRRPCNWTSHAAIGAGIVVGLHALDVKPEYAAAASALFYIGKEVRDHAKWGNVLGTLDSNIDMATGVAGAVTGWFLTRDRRHPRAVEVAVGGGEGGGTIGLQITTR
jgi:hypothetical protein